MNTESNYGYTEYTYYTDNNKNIDFDYLNKLTYHADIANIAVFTHFVHCESLIYIYIVYIAYICNYGA